jgi:hypothetical protein
MVLRRMRVEGKGFIYRLEVDTLRKYEVNVIVGNLPNPRAKKPIF